MQDLQKIITTYENYLFDLPAKNLSDKMFSQKYKHCKNYTGCWHEYDDDGVDWCKNY